MLFVSIIIIGVASYGALGHVPPRLTTIYFFQCTLTYTKCDCDYNKTQVITIRQSPGVMHPLTFVPLLAPNPGDATDNNDCNIDGTPAELIRRFAIWLFCSFREVIADRHWLISRQSRGGAPLFAVRCVQLGICCQQTVSGPSVLTLL